MVQNHYQLILVRLVDDDQLESMYRIDLFVAFNSIFSGRCNLTLEEMMIVLQDRVFYTVCTVEHIQELNLMHDKARERTRESESF